MQDGQGVFRGRCTECSCAQYVRPVISRCDYCDHTPVAHEDIFYARPHHQQQYQQLMEQQHEVLNPHSSVASGGDGSLTASSSPIRNVNPSPITVKNIAGKHKHGNPRAAPPSPATDASSPNVSTPQQWKKQHPTFKSNPNVPAPLSFDKPEPSSKPEVAPPASTPPSTTEPPPKREGITGNPRFTISLDQAGNVFQAISFMPAFSNKSFEELRAEDYSMGNKGSPEKRESLFWQLPPPTLGPSIKDTSNLPTAFVGMPLPPSASAPFSSKKIETERTATAQRQEAVQGIKRLAEQLEKSAAVSDVFAVNSILYQINALTAPFGFPLTPAATPSVTTDPSAASGAAAGTLTATTTSIPAEVASIGQEAEGFFSNRRYYVLGKFVSFVEDVMHEFKDISHSKSDHFDAILKHNKLEANLNSFLNSEHGGVLYFGIHDTGRVVGVKLTREHIDLVKHGVWSKMESFNPVPSPHLYTVEAVQIFDRKGKSLTNLVVLEVRVVGGSNIYFNKEDKAWVRRDAGNYMFKNGADLRDFIEQRKLYQREKKEKSMKRKGRREGGGVEGGSVVEGGAGVVSVYVGNEERQKLFKQEYGDEGDGNYKMRERKPVKIKERNTLLRMKREKEKEEREREKEKEEGKEKEKPIEEEKAGEEVGVVTVREEGQEEVDVLRRKIEELERLLWEERETRLNAATPVGEGEIPQFMLLPEVPVTIRMRRGIRRGKGKGKGKEKEKEKEPECEKDKEEDTNKDSEAFPFEPPPEPAPQPPDMNEEEDSHGEETPAEKHNESQQETVVVADITETKKDEMEQEIVDTQTPVSLLPASTEAGDTLEPMEAEQVVDRPEGEDSGDQKPIEVGETQQLNGVEHSSETVRGEGEGVVPLDMVIEEVGTVDIERSTKEDKEGKEQNIKEDDGEPKHTTKNEGESEAVSDNLGGNEGMQDEQGKEDEAVPEEVDCSQGEENKQTNSQNGEAIHRQGGEEGEREVEFAVPQDLVEAKEIAVVNTLEVKHEDVQAEMNGQSKDNDDEEENKLTGEHLANGEDDSNNKEAEDV